MVRDFWGSYEQEMIARGVHVDALWKVVPRTRPMGCVGNMLDFRIFGVVQPDDLLLCTKENTSRKQSDSILLSTTSDILSLS